MLDPGVERRRCHQAESVASAWPYGVVRYFQQRVITMTTLWMRGFPLKRVTIKSDVTSTHPGARNVLNFSPRYPTAPGRLGRWCTEAYTRTESVTLD